jgi:hypothetical protein
MRWARDLASAALVAAAAMNGRRRAHAALSGYVELTGYAELFGSGPVSRADQRRLLMCWQAARVLRPSLFAAAPRLRERATAGTTAGPLPSTLGAAVPLPPVMSASASASTSAAYPSEAVPSVASRRDGLGGVEATDGSSELARVGGPSSADVPAPVTDAIAGRSGGELGDPEPAVAAFIDLSASGPLIAN